MTTLAAAAPSVFNIIEQAGAGLQTVPTTIRLIKLIRLIHETATCAEAL